MTDGESREQELQREIEALRRQLRDQREGHAAVPENRWKPSGLNIAAILLGLVVLLAVAFFAGYTPLQKRETLVRAESEARAAELPRLEVMTIGRSPGSSELKLPGSLQAVTEAPILARADGYLKTRLVDLGDHVKAGQPLAEIEAPELDHQTQQAAAAVEQAQAALEQALAALEQGKANRDLAKLTAGRWKELAAQGVVSQQDNDTNQAQYRAQDANVAALEKAIAAQRSNVAAAKANLARFEDVQNYRIVRAPFDGVITLRNVDVGALVSTGNTLLYRIAQTGTLRTYLNVPQVSANSVHVGQAAHLTFSNFPGQTFAGVVKRTANSLDPSSRTLLVEVEVPNANGALLPGLYTEVDLSTARANPPLLLPASALVVRANGAQVAEVDQDGVVHLRKVTVGRDYGDRVEIAQGVTEGSAIVIAPGDNAQEGAHVVPVRPGNAQQ